MKTKPSEAAVTDVAQTIQSLDLGSFRQAFKKWKPENKGEAIQVLHFISDILAAEKEIKPRAYAFLDNRCGDCEEHEYNGLKVVKVSPETKVYAETDEVREAQEALDNAKAALQDAKDRAGFETKPGTSYWKAVR
jgi:hypothetical protein